MKKRTFEELYQEALKYKTRTDFSKGNRGAYSIAWKTGILDQICSHMPEHSNKRWLDEELYQEALKFQTRNTFKKGNNGAYNAACRRGILDLICSHMPEPITKAWLDEELYQEALKFNTRGEFQKKSRGAYSVALKRGILDKICSHMNLLRKSWTYEKISKEALKYDTRSEFEKGSYAAYQAICRKGKIFLDKICSHMQESKTKAWLNEELQEEALKYDNRRDFIKNSNAAYQTALRKGFLDILCSHMKRSSSISLPENHLTGIIKEKFPKTLKIKDMRVKIEGKPYIHGFEIDIFIPELNKGVEFDGEYHHSFEYMRKDKSKKFWLDEDLRRYHEIKDSWFLTKGIQILHIKEKDWKKDRQLCIKNCLEFLGVKCP